MAPDDDKPEPTVRELLSGAKLDDVVDAATQAELAKWFSLPSVEVAREQGMDLPEDPEVAAILEARARALECVDPQLVESVYRRVEDATRAMFSFNAVIELRIKPEMGAFDHAMADRHVVAVEPRDREIDEALRDEMKEVAPQALLRDLHRPEDEYAKQFEMIDHAAAQRYDIVAEVAAAMKESWALPALPRVSAIEEQRQLIAKDRATRRRPWNDVRDSLKVRE